MSEVEVDGFTIIPMPGRRCPFGAKVIGPRGDGYCFGSAESANSAAESGLTRKEAKDAANAYLKWRSSAAEAPEPGAPEFTVTPEPVQGSQYTARVTLKGDDSGRAWVFDSVADADYSAANWAAPIPVAAAKAYLEEYEVPTTPPAEHDPVAHPSHYTAGKIEVIDFILDQKLPYCLGNVVKYVSRAGRKDPAKTVEDLRKAVFYLEAQIKLEQEDRKW